MIWIESIGWLALGLNVWGNLLLAKKSTPGWLIRLACNFAWVIYSIIFCVWPLLVNHIIFAGINIYGWMEWSKVDFKVNFKCSCGRYYTTKDIGTNCLCEKPYSGEENK